METEPERGGPYLWMVLFKAYKTVERRDLESVQGQGFACLSDFAVLEVLYNKGPLPVSVIGEKVMLTSGSITTAVQRAVSHGWVEKRVDGTDRRISRVHLTAEGETLISGAYARHAANLDKVFSVLSTGERASLATLLKKVGKGG